MDDERIQFPVIKYLGHSFFHIADRLYVKDDTFEGGFQYFEIPGRELIVSVVHRTPPEKPVEHLEVNIKDHQFVLIGGPRIVEMYLVPIK